MSFGLQHLQIQRLHDLDVLPVRFILFLVHSLLRKPGGHLSSARTLSCIFSDGTYGDISSRREARGSWSFSNKNLIIFIGNHH